MPNTLYTNLNGDAKIVKGDTPTDLGWTFRSVDDRVTDPQNRMLALQNDIDNLQNQLNNIQNAIAGAFTGNLSSAGWTKLPNGLIIQWDYKGWPTSQNYNFPIPFPKQVFAVYATNATAQGLDVDNAYAYPINNSTYFCGTKESVNDNSYSTYPCYILALGI